MPLYVYITEIRVTNLYWYLVLKNDIPGTNWTKFSFREVPGLYITHRSNPSGSNRVHRYKKTSNHGKTNTLF